MSLVSVYLLVKTLVFGNEGHFQLVFNLIKKKDEILFNVLVIVAENLTSIGSFYLFFRTGQNRNFSADVYVYLALSGLRQKQPVQK
jgi:hypothetical protein